MGFRFLSCFSRHEKVKVLLVDNLILQIYLANVSNGCSNPPQGAIGASNRNVGKISLQDQVVYQENLHLFKKIMTVRCGI